jgi:crossover junction endodeoxyribonuclease RuvC
MSGQAIRIIGIDPGLRRTGWGIIETEGSALSFVDGGVIVSDAAQTLAERLVQLHDGLCGIVDRHRPAEASVEQTFVSRDAAATLKLGQARGIALLVPALRGISVAEYAPNLVKKTVVGTGHGDKRQIRMMVQMLLPKAQVESADAADALAIAVTHAHHRMSRTLAAAGGS